MGPKKAKNKKGRKGSKAKQQAAEEKRLREEEEARLQAEREEQERIEREKKEKEIERLELLDLDRREDELAELCHLLETNQTAVSTWKADAAEMAQWQKYLHCDGKPNPAIQQDINTHISLWRDDDDINITSVLKQCNLGLELADELMVLVSEATDPEESQKVQDTFLDLQEVIHLKHLQTTEEILKAAHRNIDSETGNMQTVIQDDNVTLCLWANLKKNPRFKGLTFDVGLGFELPKQLTAQSVAVRILHAHYDHLSFVARLAHMTTPISGSRSLVPLEAVSEEVDSSQQGEQNECENVKENSDEQEKVKVEVQSVQDAEEGKSSSATPSRKSSAPPRENSQVETQMEALGDDEDLLSSSPPLKTGSAEPVVDLKQFSPLGGVFYFDAFYLPPQDYHINDWKIRQLRHIGLEAFPYPLEHHTSESDRCFSQPVGVSVTLPDNVVFLETPQVARWDPAEKQWRVDGIEDESYEEAEARVSFSMDSFQTFTLMQNTYVNLPLQKWELRPLGQNFAILTINGVLLSASITIQDDRCMLQTEHEKGLSHLLGKWMSWAALQRAMVTTGINIFVNEFTGDYIRNCGKDPLTEHAAYEQMALFASACAFSWSKWNAKSGAEHLVMQVCEHHGPDPVPEDAWSLYLLEAQRSQKLAITEGSEDFSSEHYPGSEFHSTFIHMLQDDMSPEGIAKTRTTHYQFVDTVQNLLCSTRPLMYA